MYAVYKAGLDSQVWRGCVPTVSVKLCYGQGVKLPAIQKGELFEMDVVNAECFLLIFNNLSPFL